MNCLFYWGKQKILGKFPLLYNQIDTQNVKENLPVLPYYKQENILKYSDLSMSEREWECPVCHTHHDRDINAALNLLEEGMHIFPEYFFWVIMNPKVKSNPLGKKYHKKSSRKAA